MYERGAPHTAPLGEQDELAERVSRLIVDRDVKEARTLMRRILHVSSSDPGSAPRRLCPSVVRLLATPDPLTKKLAAWFICHHGARHPELLLLGVNTLRQDAGAPSPWVRALALRTLAVLGAGGVEGRGWVGEHALPPALQGLTDASAGVRRGAVLALARLWSTDRDTLCEAGVIDRLYALIRDPDPVVVTNALCALEEMLADEGGVVVNHNIARHLISRIQSFPEHSLPYILSILSKYRPITSQQSCVTSADPTDPPSQPDFAEVVELLNGLDPCLSSATPSVVIQTAIYFRQLAGSMSPEVDQDIVDRIKGQVLHLLGAADPETALMLLEFIRSLLPLHARSLRTHYRQLFCRYTDPVWLQAHKVALLGLLFEAQITSLGGEGGLEIPPLDLDEVVDELGRYCGGECAPMVVRGAVRVLGGLAGRLGGSVSRAGLGVCAGLLDRLPADSGVIGDVLRVLESLDLSQLSDALPHILPALERCCTTLLAPPCPPDLPDAPPGPPGALHGPSRASTQCAALSVLARHGDKMASTPYILERFVSSLLPSKPSGGGWEELHANKGTGKETDGQTSSDTCERTGKGSMIPSDRTEQGIDSSTGNVTGSRTGRLTETEEGGLVQAQALSAAMALFLARPAKGQEVLGAALQACWASDCADTRDRALFCYRCLRADPRLARSLLC